MYYVYAISSLNRNYIYVGLTGNIERRLNEHNSGKNRTTKPYRPFLLIFTQICPTREEARKLEVYYKSGIGKEKLRQIRNAQNDIDSNSCT
ncbi:GIY-YIG nuclease family protein [uncultured Flavobacterium sp.]|uniref:GIY-YIG nuclease family protein n=1 Tax=uncultured Flavobacterium sp. TaxID=165435 RepID=UPI0025F5D5BD|nr:GIY-YIG nuclease family protein [uncultured Flavobacterium sp.]